MTELNPTQNPQTYQMIGQRLQSTLYDIFKAGNNKEIFVFDVEGDFTTWFRGECVGYETEEWRMSGEIEIQPATADAILYYFDYDYLLNLKLWIL
jgi:hypothetical protein